MSPHTGGPPYTCFPVIETAAGLRSKGSRVTVNERKKIPESSLKKVNFLGTLITSNNSKHEID